MTHLATLLILLFVYLPPLPIPPVTIVPRVLPEYRCDRADSFWCVLKPGWRLA